MDLLGCSVVGTLTAVGGGTVRDLLLGNQAFWVAEWEYIVLCLASAGATLACWKQLDEAGIVKEDGALFWAGDTLGIGAFCVIGAQNAVRMGLHPVICILCGVCTSTFGGVMRDVLCNRPVRILHSKSEVTNPNPHRL